jgi:hypothetical protein
MATVMKSLSALELADNGNDDELLSVLEAVEDGDDDDVIVHHCCVFQCQHSTVISGRRFFSWVLRRGRWEVMKRD